MLRWTRRGVKKNPFNFRWRWDFLKQRIDEDFMQGRITFLRLILSTLKCLDYLLLWCEGIWSIRTWRILQRQEEVVQDSMFQMPLCILYGLLTKTFYEAPIKTLWWTSSELDCPVVSGLWGSEVIDGNPHSFTLHYEVNQRSVKIEVLKCMSRCNLAS